MCCVVLSCLEQQRSGGVWLLAWCLVGQVLKLQARVPDQKFHGSNFGALLSQQVQIVTLHTGLLFLLTALPDRLLAI